MSSNCTISLNLPVSRKDLLLLFCLIRTAIKKEIRRLDSLREKGRSYTPLSGCRHLGLVKIDQCQTMLDRITDVLGEDPEEILKRRAEDCTDPV